MRWKLQKHWALRLAVLVGLAFLAASVPAAGCFVHQCDPSTYPWTSGRITEDNTYETNAIDEPWLDYPGNVTIHVHYPIDVGAAGLEITPLGYVALSSPNGGPDGGQADGISQAVGQLAVYNDFNSQGFTVTNATCAHYYARFVVHFETPLDGGTDALDEGADAGAAAFEEGADGGTD